MAESSLRRHPYATVVLITGLATLLMFVGQWLVEFPPFFIFLCAVGICFQVFGPRPGLLSMALSAPASDFLFIEPLLTFTRYTFFFAVLYSIGGLMCWFLGGRRLI